MTCDCGNPSKGTPLRQKVINKAGDIKIYVYKERRCQKCINKAIKQSELKPING